MRGGVFGYGIDDAVIDAYEWPIETFDDGDEIFIFGFSRGAYTAFGPTVYSRFEMKMPDPDAPSPKTLEQTEQRWFVGAHANVGGGVDNDLLAQVPLKWLLGKAVEHGLAFRGDVEPIPTSSTLQPRTASPNSRAALNASWN